jgi:hypothetical protein
MSKTVSYFGTCDASAAVRLDPSLFVAASDEDSCVYDSGVPGPPSSSLDLIDFLNPINRQGEGRREVARTGYRRGRPDWRPVVNIACGFCNRCICHRSLTCSSRGGLGGSGGLKPTDTTMMVA